MPHIQQRLDLNASNVAKLADKCDSNMARQARSDVTIMSMFAELKASIRSLNQDRINSVPTDMKGLQLGSDESNKSAEPINID